MNHTYETTFEAFDDNETLLGPIELLVHYTYSPGSPARIRYDEYDHPAYPGEIEVVKVEMDIAEYRLQEIRIAHKWVPAFKWLDDWAVNNVSTDDLVENAEQE